MEWQHAFYQRLPCKSMKWKIENEKAYNTTDCFNSERNAHTHSVKMRVAVGVTNDGERMGSGTNMYRERERVIVFGTTLNKSR